MKTLLVASFGGHLVQLERLADHLSLDERQWVTTRPDAMAQSHETIPDFNKTTLWRALPCAFAIVGLLRRFRCEAAISTGAAPGLLCLLLARLGGARTIWIDSVANVERLSLSGRVASRLCHLTLTQWPELADGRRVTYLGSVL
ncbi:oligosaccharide biosynthesis protein Alg14 [Salinicola halophilus]|uniref:oligosaccharide biosynthesis protein Alg14 n=1 Tax=Salinicola halophilus TaxID=184065 RepID=UPI000DA1F790|nr:oligosaccharide biosynthesis protein Alg14 [Salinicola halophilus]